MSHKEKQHMDDMRISCDSYTECREELAAGLEKLVELADACNLWFDRGPAADKFSCLAAWLRERIEEEQSL